MKKSIFIIISVLFFGISFYLGLQTQQNLSKFQRYKIAYTSELNFQSSLLDIKDYINEGEWNRTKQEGTESWKKAYRAKQTSTYYSSILGGFIFIYLLLIYFLYRKNKVTISQLGYGVLHASLVFLSVGISLPFLELGAYMDNLKVDIGMGLSKTFEGKMYFFYQSKTVLELIQNLFQNGNFFVAIAIFKFSILFPFIKLGLFYYYLISTKMNHKKKLLKLASYIGKYSMADVFVAACFLSFLSFNNLNMGIKTESSVLVGMYFFLGYCLLSIATYFVIKTKINSTKINPQC